MKIRIVLMMTMTTTRAASFIDNEGNKAKMRSGMSVTAKTFVPVSLIYKYIKYIFM